MRVITAREFRSNQTKILSAARAGQTVMLTSRVGYFKIIPVSDDDEIVAKSLKAAQNEVLAHLKGEISLKSAKDVIF